MKIFEWAAGAASLRMAYLGLKLGMFEAITQSPSGLSLEELAERTGLDTRYLAAWARTALAGGLLEYRAPTGRLRMAPFMEQLLLDPSDFQYSAGLATSFAVESRLADRVAGCFASGEG